MWTPLLESPVFNDLAPEQQTKIRAIEAMDIPTFDQQSLEEQLAFGAFVREVYQDYAIAATRHNALDISLPQPKDVNLESSGQDILNDEGFKMATARWSQGPIQSSSGPSAGRDGRKLAPSRVHRDWAPEQYEGVATLTSSQTNSEIVENIRAWFDGKKPTTESRAWAPAGPEYNGKTFKVIQTLTEDDSGKNQFYFAYFPFTDIYGKEDGVWILTSNVLESDAGWVANLSPAYPAS